MCAALGATSQFSAAVSTYVVSELVDYACSTTSSSNACLDATCCRDLCEQDATCALFEFGTVGAGTGCTIKSQPTCAATPISDSTSDEAAYLMTTFAEEDATTDPLFNTVTSITCASGCLSNVDCPSASPYCVSDSRTCSDVCTADSQCGSGQSCNTTTGACFTDGTVTGCYSAGKSCPVDAVRAVAHLLCMQSA